MDPNASATTTIRGADHLSGAAPASDVSHTELVLYSNIEALDELGQLLGELERRLSIVTRPNQGQYAESTDGAEAAKAAEEPSPLVARLLGEGITVRALSNQVRTILGALDC